MDVLLGLQNVVLAQPDNTLNMIAIPFHLVFLISFSYSLYQVAIAVYKDSYSAMNAVQKYLRCHIFRWKFQTLLLAFKSNLGYINNIMVILFIGSLLLLPAEG